MKVVILAGGGGTRLWPLSRASTPKQVQPFLDSHTLLQRTWQRLRQGFAARDIFVATTSSQLALVRAQLPKLARGNIFVEPAGRNTAPAVGYLASVLAQRFPREVVATVNSDHHISNTAAYLRALKAGERAVFALPNRIVLLGVRPTYPETGYGYIEAGLSLRGAFSAREVARFAEKPTLARAQRYLAHTRYLWNTGLFLFYPRTLLDIMSRTAPTLAAGLKKIARAGGARLPMSAPRAFLKLPAISLDYAVLEKTRQLAVLPVSFGWTDVGHWRSVYDIQQGRSPRANVSRGLHVSLSSTGNLVYAPKGKLVATVGLRDTIVVDTGDALLVCSRSEAQKVRDIVAELKRKQSLTRYL